MRLHLRARLVDVSHRPVNRDSPPWRRPLVVLTFEAVGQPELPPLVDLYAVNQEVGVNLLRWAAERVGVPLEARRVRHVDPERLARELNEGRERWREVTLEVEGQRWEGKDRLVVRRVLRPDLGPYRDPEEAT